MRTIIELSAQQAKTLDGVCKAQKISRVEAIRRALHAWLPTQTPPTNKDDYFGIWADRADELRDHVRRIRSEWE